jgi:hypothetical protein
MAETEAPRGVGKLEDRLDLVTQEDDGDDEQDHR